MLRGYTRASSSNVKEFSTAGQTGISKVFDQQMILLGNLFGTQNYQGDFHYNGSPKSR